eukprot:4379652-Amphidinium_carterae.1
MSLFKSQYCSVMCDYLGKGKCWICAKHLSSKTNTAAEMLIDQSRTDTPKMVSSCDDGFGFSCTSKSRFNKQLETATNTKANSSGKHRRGDGFGSRVGAGEQFLISLVLATSVSWLE